MRIPALALLLVVTAACGGDRAASSAAAGADGGTLVITAPADADGFLPPITASGPSSVIEQQVFERLAEPGMRMNTYGDAGFTPLLATRWTWSRDSLSIAFQLDPRARWHDGKPVTARDVRFTLELNRDSTIGSVTRPLVASIDSVTTPDSLTAVFWFSHRYPEQFFDATYQMRILPEHLLAPIARKDLASASFGRQPVGSGPFKFVRWDEHQSIVLEANLDYHLGRPHLDRVIWSIAPDPNTAVLRLFSGEADFLEYLRPADIAELAKHPELQAVSHPDFSYGFVLFNLRDPKHPGRPSPLFADRELRRALTMVIDRQALVKSVFDSLAGIGHGPVTRNYATYDSTVALLPYAPDSAAKLLDALGWKRGPDGVRSKGGRPLSFTLMVPASSAARRNMAVLLQDAFKKAGVTMELDQLDFATFYRRLPHREFEAAINVTGLDPSPGNMRQSWGSTAAGPADGNYGNYMNPVFDANVDSALRQMDVAKAHAYFKRAYQTIVDDAPAIWIYEPATFAGSQRRIHEAGVRPDAWHADIREWYIPAGERSERDRAATLPAPSAAPAAPSKP